MPAGSRRGLLLLPFLLGLLACARLGALPPAGTVSPATEVGASYRAEFDRGPSDWHSLMMRDGALIDIQWQPAGGKSGAYVSSENPWWVDANHAPPGAGYLHLVAYLYVASLQPNTYRDQSGLPAIDLRGATLTLALRGEHVDLQRSHLVFWMQGYAPSVNRWVNYALTGQPLDAALASGQWTDVVLPLPDDPSQWTCLGSAEAKADLYGCATVPEVLANLNGDFGLLLFPLDWRSGRLPTGRIGIDAINLQYTVRASTPTPTPTGTGTPTPTPTGTGTPTLTPTGTPTPTPTGTSTGIPISTARNAWGPGVRRPSNGALYLKSQSTTGFADALLAYGLPGDRPITGDWTGKGFKSVGVYRNGQFSLRNSNTVGFADIEVVFGLPGDLPVVGDWNGDGIDTIGVYRDGTYYLRNSNTTGPPELVVTLGVPGDVPLAGDWTGKGFDSVGVFRPSNGALFLKNANTTGFADIALAYGLPGDQPVVGDWNGDGVDTIGVYRNGQFLLRNSNTLGFAEIEFALGVAGDEPIAGHWGPLPSPAPARGPTRGR